MPPSIGQGQGEPGGAGGRGPSQLLRDSAPAAARGRAAAAHLHFIYFNACCLNLCDFLKCAINHCGKGRKDVCQPGCVPERIFSASLCQPNSQCRAGVPRACRHLLCSRAPREPTARSGGPGGSAPHRGRAGHRAPPLGCSPGSFSLPCPSPAFSWAAARRHHACTGAADTVLGPGWALPVCSCCRRAPVRSANSYCSMICGFISNCCPSEEPHPPSLFVVLSLVPSGSRQPQVYFGFAWLQK